ncbi:HAD domain-containing protein [Planotetraspora sp. A-T 1434]|uniref:HAD domain-containing protein n=1 Tax=Planotetraspora sp. A-T 1434 TaxID=2979219 RepID=UPI0021BF5D6F|nr:HAD domain-containing protein [Planotetraspora sp. A-T 1434]MCT9933118.1 HAD domain-containing protein [Planotetraspora sp. A-T 1434]
MRPLILLDVDGVLNPSRRSSPRFRRYDGVLDGEPYKVLLDPRDGSRLRNLAEATGAELAWATTWEDRANEEIGPRIGLPYLPVIPVMGDPASLTGEHMKTRGIARYVRHRPFVWFDDNLVEADHEYLTRHPGVSDFLLVEVDPRTGLTDDHLGRAREWLMIPSLRAENRSTSGGSG